MGSPVRWCGSFPTVHATGQDSFDRVDEVVKQGDVSTVMVDARELGVGEDEEEENSELATPAVMLGQ